METLYKFVDQRQLPVELGGRAHHPHREWVAFRRVCDNLIYYFQINSVKSDHKNEVIQYGTFLVSKLECISIPLKDLCWKIPKIPRVFINVLLSLLKIKTMLCV